MSDVGRWRGISIPFDNSTHRTNQARQTQPNANAHLNNQQQISDKVFDLVSDPEKRDEVLAELTKQLDPAEQQVRSYVGW